ncbi:MAG: hypothetical protein MJY87_02420 [Fibrobacter sp.]|nr:hypothetical protein [Fibrobacter sp.]
MANILTVQDLNDKITAAVQDASSFIKESKDYCKPRKIFEKGTRSGTSAVLYFDGRGEVQTTDGVEGKDSSGNGAMDISKMNGDVKQYAVPINVANSKGKTTWDVVDEMFKAGNIEEDFVKPTANGLAEDLIKKVIDNAYLRSTGVAIGSMANASFKPLAAVAASLRKMRTGMTLVGHLDSEVIGELSSLPVTSGNCFGAPSDKLEELYGEAAIGTFHKIPYIDEPFMASFSTDKDPGNDCTVKEKVSNEGRTEGADFMDLKITGITGAEVILKGTAFSIAGVSRCTAAGTPLVGTPYTFVVQKDAEVSGGSATLKVLPVYFNDNTGYIPTVSVKEIAAGASIKWLTGWEKTYSVGIVRAREALNWHPVEMLDIRGCENGKTATPSMAVHTAFDGNIDNAENKGRIDVLFSGKIVDPRLVRTIYWEM